MQKRKLMNALGAALLFGAAIAWGTSFLILKNTIDKLPPLYVLGIRFLSSAILIGLICIKKTVRISKGTFIRGAIIGLSVFFAYLTQTYGLKYTTPGQNAFITSLYCVMTPFFMWLIYKVKPRSYNIVAAVMCVVGIALVAFSGAQGDSANVVLGNALTFAGAVFYAFQVIFTDRFSKKADDPMQLLTVNLFTIGVLFSVCSAAIEIPVYGIASFALDKTQILNILYLTLACTLFAQFAQLVGQRLTTASQSAVILSLEGVFGTLFSVIMGAEKLTVAMGLGFAVIFAATLISELKPDFSKLLNINKNRAFSALNNKSAESGDGKEEYVIASDSVKVTVAALGAETVSVIKDGKERLWQNENGEWDGHAPVLFPVCGKCEIVVGGKAYPVIMHGIAPVCKFIPVERGEDFIRLRLQSSAETEKYYPFGFFFDVVYTASGNSLFIRYEIENPTDGDAYYSCGAHDSFAIDGELEEYVAEFEKSENFVNLVHNDDGILTGESEDLGGGTVLDFGETPLVDDKTFIFKNVNSRSVVLRRRDGEKIAKIDFKGFDNLLFWRPGAGRTVCVEPWLNLPDTAGAPATEFSEKYGVRRLKAGEKATFTRVITYY